MGELLTYAGNHLITDTARLTRSLDGAGLTISAFALGGQRPQILAPDKLVLRKRALALTPKRLSDINEHSKNLAHEPAMLTLSAERPLQPPYCQTSVCVFCQQSATIGIRTQGRGSSTQASHFVSLRDAHSQEARWALLPPSQAVRFGGHPARRLSGQHYYPPLRGGRGLALSCGAAAFAIIYTVRNVRRHPR